ncbi:hypothetical protein [Terrarubrum flagellatum]|uniref:hypothetical protein n=1 Tax=Terrirubrum flagellatum TaxID=2895980 RepID=UPI003145576B
MKSFYAAYFTGAAGSSIGLFFIGDGIIAGVDVGGIRYDGSFKTSKKGGALEGVVEFIMPPGATLITGISGGAQETRVPVPIHLPSNFADGQVIRIETPAGPVNVRFEKLRDLP